MAHWRIFYSFQFFCCITQKPLQQSHWWSEPPSQFQSSDSLVKCFHLLSQAHQSLSPQTTGKGVDGGPLTGDMPPLLCPRGDAHLCRQSGGKVQLEQERVWNGAGQLLLGLLLHPSVRGLRQRQVGNKRATVCYFVL